MSWFDEKIRLRRRAGQEIMDESFFHIASSVLGKQQAGVLGDKRVITKAAIDEILKYYHFKPAEIPEEITDRDEQLEYCLRPHGLMRRSIRLSKGWYRNAMGPVLAFRKEDGAATALLPKTFSGYRYTDPVSGENVSLNRAAAEQFREDAFCFYYPLPLKKLDIRDLLLYIKNCLNADDFIMLFALTLAVTVLGMLMTDITRALTGFVLESGSVQLLTGTAFFMLSALISSQLISASRQLMTDRIGMKASLALEAAVMMRIMNLPAPFFRQYSSGELYSRYSSVGQICDLLLGSVFSLGLGACMSLLYLTQIFQFAPALTLPSMVIILTGIGISTFSGLAQRSISRRIMEKSAKKNGLSFALITGIQKIRLAGAEKPAFAKWGHAYADAAELMYNPPMFIRVNTAITTAVSLAGTVVLFYLAVDSGVSPSEYIAFNTAYGAVTAAFAAITGAALSTAGIRPILEMAEPILRAEPESSENKSIVTNLSGSIELSNVYFRYGSNTPYVISGMNLKINPGEYVGIVGTTGCGKSTLVRLLLGFETPERGAVYYDGKDLTGLDLDSVRRRIGTVMQDGSLFQGDIFSNITISAPQLGLKEAWEAAELAGIADDIRSMPMGMNTQISEGQGGVSGGQKQRLMIARALAPKPKILIFDEATSALDNFTQKQISEALDRLDCTRIVIAHRLSTIRNCSRILVMDSGRIIEEGTYDELLADNGIFAELIARQRLDT